MRPTEFPAMTRTAESGAYVGGIAAMLSQADVCPSCGDSHNDRRFGFRLPSSSGCPKVVFGSLPTVTSGPELDFPHPTPSLLPRAEAQPMLPTQAGTLVPLVRRASNLAIPWPMPTQTEDYL